MFGFLKNIFKKKAKPVEDKKIEAVKSVAPPIIEDTESIIDIAYINEEYDAVLDVANKFSKFNKYNFFAGELKDILISVGKKEFTKKNLSDFILNAENIMNKEYEEFNIKKQKIAELKPSISAIEDIFRIEKLMSDVPDKISALNTALSEILESIQKVDDPTDILNISEKINSTYDYVKDITYAIGFLNERIDLLIDRDTQSQSIKYYAKKYSDYDSTFSNSNAKLVALVTTKNDLEEKLESYKNRAGSLRNKGLINLDWDGSKYKKLEQMRKALTDGYAKLDSGCSLVHKNLVTIIENLSNSNDELNDYVISLIPKLSDNVQKLKAKYSEMTDKSDVLTKQLEAEGNELKNSIELLNTLY